MAVPTRGLTKSVIVRPGQYIRGRDRGSTRIVARETAPLRAHPHQPDQPLQVLLRIELEANRTLGAAAPAFAVRSLTAASVPRPLRAICSASRTLVPPWRISSSIRSR